jgi:hypothetical protein
MYLAIPKKRRKVHNIRDRLAGDHLGFTEDVRKRDDCRALFLQTESLDERPALLVRSDGG